MPRDERPATQIQRWADWVAILLLSLMAACGGGGRSAAAPPAPGPAPAGLSYALNPAVYTLGQAIPANAPTWSGGTITSFAMAPALPAGLALDLATGVLAGTPTALGAAAPYTITGTGPGGSTQAVVSLGVVDRAPSIAYSSGSYTFATGTTIALLTPQNTGGAVVIWSISPALPAGLMFSASDGSISGTPSTVAVAASYTVTATNTGGTSSASFQITVRPPAPTGLAYGTNPAVYTLGQAIPANQPTWTGGGIEAFSVAPPLPPGLALNAVSGVITGTPSALRSLATYTITGTGPGGSTQAQVQLTVVDVPPAISYGSGSYTFTTGQAIASLTPANAGGAAVSWSVSPAVPAGLVFSTVDGSLSGTPTAVNATTTYLITASNSGGSSSVSPQLTVNPPPPSISLQPVDATVDYHGAAVFTVAATGTGTLGYQWWRDGAPITGATGPTYTLAPLSAADDGAAFHAVVSDAYGGSVTSVTVHVTVQPDLAAWLVAHPRVASAIRWQFRPANPGNLYQAPADADKVAWTAWSPQQQADLNQAFLEAKAWFAQGAHQVAMDPAGLTDEPVNQHPQTSIDTLTTLQWVTPAHMWKLYVAHVAFALAQELSHPLPWSLVDDTDETLRYLLDSSVMAWYLPSGNFWMGTYAGAYPPALRADTRPHTTFAPPMWTYPWLQQAGLIGATRQETIGKVMEWMRGHMTHFFGPDTFGNHQAVWQYRGHVPLSKLVGGTIDGNNPGYGTQHWTAGCHGSVGFLHAVLRVLNVPVQPVWICGHELAHFPSEKLYLDHGDDPYNQVVKNHPASPVLNLLIDEATYQAWFTPDLTVNINGTNATALANVGRKAAEFQ